MKKYILFFLIVNLNLSAESDAYVQITKNLRCLACVNQSVFDSSSTFATEVKESVVVLLNQGADGEKIYDVMTVKYGSEVLYHQQDVGDKIILWFIPALLLLISVIWSTRKVKFK